MSYYYNTLYYIILDFSLVNFRWCKVSQICLPTLQNKFSWVLISRFQARGTYYYIIGYESRKIRGVSRFRENLHHAAIRCVRTISRWAHAQLQPVHGPWSRFYTNPTQPLPQDQQLWLHRRCLSHFPHSHRKKFTSIYKKNVTFCK